MWSISTANIDQAAMQMKPEPSYDGLTRPKKNRQVLNGHHQTKGRGEDKFEITTCS